MKILHISSEPPGDRSGGQLVVKESIYALSKLSELDYIGPEIERESNVLKLVKKIYLINSNMSILKRIGGILTLNFSSFYNSFKERVKDINEKSYEYVYIEFSKWLFAANYFKRLNNKIIIRLHNIEKDYSYNLFKINKTSKNYISYLYYSYIEKSMVSISDKIIVLTEKDKNRLIEIYNNIINKDDIIVMPVCVKKKSTNNHIINRNSMNLLITGSLWYGPNYEGVKWFINNVWNEIQEYCNLYVVGSKPNKELIELISKNKKIKLVENPVDTQKYFELADIYISPIFNGAGMKVKNAEAMSYGIPIMGTAHSFIGYESSMGLHYVANSKEQFEQSIVDFKSKNIEEVQEIKTNIINDFNNKYNIENSYKYLQKLLLKV